MSDSATGTAEPKGAYRNEYKRLGMRRTATTMRLEVLEATRRSLRDGCYETLSMEEVAARAATTRRTLYNLFTDKNDLYRSSCEHLLKVVANRVTDEIPERMAPSDGIRYFVGACMEVYEGDDALDLTLSIVRDGSKQQWLVQAYHREVHNRLVRACENFILKVTRRAPLAPGVPKFIGEQLVSIVKALTVGPHIFSHSNRPELLGNDRLEVLASAYAAMLDTQIRIGSKHLETSN